MSTVALNAYIKSFMVKYVETLGKKLLPSTMRLAQERGGDPSEHWLRKMPEHTKPWRYREKAVNYLAKALAAFEKSLGRPQP